MKKAILFSVKAIARVFRSSTFIFLFLSLLSFCFSTIAQQPGDIDLTFGNPIKVLGDSSRFDGRVNVLLRQPDDKILAGGSFSKYNGTTRNRIARLNPDGSPDASFLIASGFNDDVSCIAYNATSNKIYVGGSFTTIDAQPYAKLTRLNADGTLDLSFIVGTGFNGTVNTVAIQSDGKVIVGGSFTSYRDTLCNNIVRLHTNGSIDKSFVFGTGFNSYLTKATIQTDGKIIVGGNFTSYNGTAKSRILRLNTDGSIDPTFTIGTGFNAYVQTITIQADAKILVGGNFTSYAGTAVGRVCRLAADGTIDPTFISGTGLNGVPYSITVLPSGDIYLGGSFTSYNSAVANQILRITSGGEIDKTFSRKFGGNIGVTGGYVSSICLEPSGNILIGGEIDNYFNTTRNNIARVQSDGFITRDFSVAYGVDNGTLGTRTEIKAIAIQTDGKILAGGSFTTYDGYRSPGIVRLSKSGKIDTSFYLVLGGTAYVQDVKVDTINQKIYIAGMFNSVNGVTRNNLARLNMNGTLDNTFNTGNGFSSSVSRMVLLPNGKVIAVGSFATYDNTPSNRIARLNQNGSLDLTFTIGTGFNNIAYDIELQPDGKIIVGGVFSQYNGVDRKAIIRLNENGTQDATFQTGTGFTGVNSTVYEAIIQKDGKILCVGNFNAYNGTDLDRTGRLNSDGTIDNTFKVVGYTTVFASAILKDERIIVGGTLSDNKHIACVDSKGIMDATFDVGTGFNNVTKIFAVQPDGKLLVGGEFTSYDGYTIYKLTRLHAGSLETGFEDLELKINSGWTLYPNPSSGRVTVLSIEAGNLPAMLTVSNSLGETLNQTTLSKLQTSFDFNLPTGAYFVTLSTDKSSTTKQVLIQAR